MAYQPDVDAMAPALELTIDYAVPSLGCVGTLDARTRHHLVASVTELLAAADGRSTITIDIGSLELADLDAAHTLTHVEHMVRGAGMGLHWRGLGSDRLTGILPLTCLAGRPTGRPRPRRVPRPIGATHPSVMPPSA